MKVSERRNQKRTTGVKGIPDSLCFTLAEKKRVDRKLKALEARIKCKVKVTKLKRRTKNETGKERVSRVVSCTMLYRHDKMV